jgi:hypothetical protein
MNRTEKLLSVFATCMPIVAFIEKHSTFFVGAAAILSCGWWAYVYFNKIIIPFFKTIRKNEKNN